VQPVLTSLRDHDHSILMVAEMWRVLAPGGLSSPAGVEHLYRALVTRRPGRVAWDGSDPASSSTSGPARATEALAHAARSIKTTTSE